MANNNPGPGQATPPIDEAKKPKEGEAKKPEITAPDIIWVRSARKDNRVAFTEKDERHPVYGEAFVAGSTPRRVFATDGIKSAILAGKIEKCDPPLTKGE